MILAYYSDDQCMVKKFGKTLLKKIEQKEPRVGPFLKTKNIFANVNNCDYLQHGFSHFETPFSK